MKNGVLLQQPDIQTKLRELELQGYLSKESRTWTGYGFTENGHREASKYIHAGDSVVDWAGLLCGYVPDDWRLPTGARNWKKEAR